jgi:photosystem II stability/assembly factor-like uncharacterized protein
VAASKTTRKRPPPVKLLSQRSPALDWRREWFRLSRSDDDSVLLKARDRANEHKQRLIDEHGRTSKFRAGYDPAGFGSPWYSIGPRNVNGRVKALAVHPTNPNIVYAGAASGGVWKTTDGGETWDPQWDMQESLAMGALAIARSSPQTVYAGTGEFTTTTPSYPGAGVYVSTNGGATWSLRNTCKCRRVGTLVVDPANPLRVWMCGNAGLERTTDGGTTWTQLRTDTVTDVALDPANASNVFIGVQGKGLFKSTDGGTTFAILPGSPTGGAVMFPQVAIGTSGAHTNKFIAARMGGAVLTSIDGGTTFTTVSTGHDGQVGWDDVIACAPDDESMLFVGSLWMERSTDGGATWTVLNTHADQHEAVFAPSDPNIMYFSNDGGVYRSDDKGASARKVSNGLVVTQFYDLGFWRTLSNVIGGGAQDNATNYTTGGLTWKSLYQGDGGWFVIDPSDPRTIYFESQRADLQKSIDGGATWTPVSTGVTGASSVWEAVLTMDPNDHLRLYYGTDRVLRTKDGCATAWTAVSQQLAGFVSAIAVAESDSKRVYAGAIGKTYRTDDGGDTTTWADKSAGLPPGGIVSGIWIDPANRDIVLIAMRGEPFGATSAQTVFRTTNGGNTWRDVSGDLPPIAANAVVVDPSNATTFYAGTDGGVYRTTNGGASWLPFDNGIPNVIVSDLKVDRGTKILYAGTMGRGAYKLDITPGITKPAVDLYLRDHDLDTGERVPSPSGLPDPLQPGGTSIWWLSPDIKMNHAPFYAPTGSVFDGVHFDSELVHQDPRRTETNRIYVQVHNRGFQTATNVSVRAFIADASSGPPVLPAPLVPPNFALPKAIGWMPVGPPRTIAKLVPNRPAVVSWDFDFPASTATHSCCLAVLSSPDDPFTSPETQLTQFIPFDKHVCLKNLHVVDPGSAAAPATIVGLDFFAPPAVSPDVATEVVVQPAGFGRGTVGIVFPKTVKIQPPRTGLVGVEVVQLRTDDPIGTWYAPGGRDADMGLDKRWRGLDRSRIWMFDSNRPSRLPGIRLEPGRAVRAAVVLSHKRDVATPVAPRVAIELRVGGKTVGGSTFQIGYDNSSSPAQVMSRRVRIRATRLERASRRGTALWVRVTIADDAARSTLAAVEDGRLFDGYVADGESLLLELIETSARGRPDTGDVLFSRRFEGHVDSWSGTHRATRGRGALKLAYSVEDVTPGETVGAD